MDRGIAKKDAKIQALRVIYTGVLDFCERGCYDFEGLGFSVDDAIKIEHCVDALLEDMRAKYEKMTGLDIYDSPVIK
jgi:hypothetical protein